MSDKVRIEKIAIICLTVIVALACCGVGYAHWTKTLDIDGTVETGEFNAGFTACSTNDPPPDGMTGKI
ncbi:unnamed protein product, partial [marine sediment metagenome]